MTTGLNHSDEERDAVPAAPERGGADDRGEAPEAAQDVEPTQAAGEVEVPGPSADEAVSDADVTKPLFINVTPSDADVTQPLNVAGAQESSAAKTMPLGGEPLALTLPDPARRATSEDERHDVPDGFFDAALTGELVWDDEESKEAASTEGEGDDLEPGRIEATVGYESGTSVYDEAETAPVQTRHMRIRIVAVVVCVAAALSVVYGLGVRRFSNRMLPNTSVNGLDVSTLTKKEVEVALKEQTEGYACTVTVGDFSMTIKGQDIAYKRAEDKMAKAALEDQSPYAWPLSLIRSDDLQLDGGVTFDKEALANLVNTAVQEYHTKVLPTSDVHVNFNEETGLYEVQGSTSGTALDAAALVSAVEKDVAAMSATSEPSAKKVTHDATVQDLPQYGPIVDAVNRSRTTDKNITVNGETVLVADAATCAQWVWIDDSGAAVVDTDAIRAWAENTVAWAVFHTDDWSNYYLSLDAFTEEFARRLREGVVDDYEAPTYDELRTEGESRQRAYERGGWNSELGRYIDVDLESQFARLFDDKGEVLWESAFVSGDMYEGHYTVTGTFQIYAMQTSQVLVGMDYDNDGTPDYESFVNYWMPFYGGYGLHDATWRSNFGGAYYYYNGSHGCVNLPYSKAEQLYGMTYVGETVNVHW